MVGIINKRAEHRTRKTPPLKVGVGRHVYYLSLVEHRDHPGICGKPAVCHTGKGDRFFAGEKLKSGLAPGVGEAEGLDLRRLAYMFVAEANYFYHNTIKRNTAALQSPPI